MDGLKKFFNDKKILVTVTSCTHVRDHYLKNTHPALQEFFGKIILFDTRVNNYKYGEDAMNKMILDLVRKEKPDYMLIDFGYDEFYIGTLNQIKKISPKTIMITNLGDDNWRYDDFSRYYSLFFDYVLISELNDSMYRKDGIKNVLFLGGANQKLFKPLNLKKKYDVTFIGTPIRDRPEFIRYLLKSNINVKIFSEGWSAYPDLKDVWGGFLDEKKITQVINQSKINLNFSKTFISGTRNTQLKGRIFEILSCSSFLLTEYFEDINLYLDNAKAVSFKTKKELVKKIKYYLKNEKIREKITNNSYKKIIKDFNWQKRIKDNFRIIMKHKNKSKKLPEINKKILCINKEDFNNLGELNKKIKNYDYISFKKDDAKFSPYKDFFQVYSLIKSKKPVSCCDYYIGSDALGNYMLFMAKRSYKLLPPEDFQPLLNLNQLMVTKEYLLKNQEQIRQIFQNSKIKFINEKNTVFVSIPLVVVKKYNKINYDSMKKSFRMKFIDELFSLISQKKILSSPYFYKLFLYGIFKDKFIIKQLYKSAFDKVNWEKLKTF